VRVLIAGGGTGGHLMPALALADAMVKVNPAVEPVLVGAQRGVEAAILPSRSYRHYLLPLQPIYRREWWKNWRWPLLTMQIMRECDRVLDTERPKIVLGTGGYAAGPVRLRAHRRGIPLAIQEQNAFPGLTTKLLARRARQVHLGFPEAVGALRLGHSTAVFELGNPIAPPPEPRPDRLAKRAVLGLPPEKPVLLVMGGSQGAANINNVIAQLVESGALTHITLLWSTGRPTWEKYSRFDAPPGRIVKAFWDPLSDAYAVADLAVSRAGAMTTAELCAWGLPAILVPLPRAAADHQRRNAVALADAGGAIYLPETALTPQLLDEKVSTLLEDRAALADLAASAKARGHPNAARDIVVKVLHMVS